MATERHTITEFIRGNDIVRKCDACGTVVKAEDSTKINKGLAKGEFAYCNECMSKLYPNYRKITIQNFNPKLAREMRDTLARKEYRR